MEFRKFPNRTFRHFLSAPLIFSVLIPVIVFDIWLELYHRVCFPLYGIKYVERKKYIRIDRQKLKYLTWTEKINCMYCGYVNGFLHYASVVAGETEKYWCGIKHQNKNEFVEPQHHKEFIAYNDEEAYQNLDKK